MIKSVIRFFTAVILIFSLLLTVGCSKKEKGDAKPSAPASSQATSSTITSQQSGSEEQSNSGETIWDYDVTEGNIGHSVPAHVSDQYNSSLPSEVTEATSSTQSTSSLEVNTAATTEKQIKIYKKAVSTVFDAIKSGDYETAKKNLIVKEHPLENSVDFDKRTMEKVDKIFAEIDYKTEKVERVSDTTVVATVKVKAINFKKVFTAYMKKCEKITSTEQGYTLEEKDKKIDQAFDLCLKKGKESYMVEKTVKLNIMGHGRDWKVEHTVPFSKACLGGIIYVSEIFS